MDEVPTCQECNEALKPNAKFCDECGASTAPKEESKEEPADGPQCPECGESVDEGAKFCGECGFKLGGKTTKTKDKPKADKSPVKEKSVKMPAKKDEKPKEKTVKLPEKEEEEEGEDEEVVDENFDFSEIDPEKEWECFGQIEPEHTECKSCAYRVKCAEKSGVEI